MAEINLNLDNQNIINDYFKDLTCDDYKESIFKGGQSFADQALNNLDISGYAKKRNNVYPLEKRGSSYLSPYIRHGLLSLKEVWSHVEKFKYEDKSKFRDELLWQEFSRHLYAIIGRKNREFLNFDIKNDPNEVVDTKKMNCIGTIENELESTGYMVNQTRMWYSSHQMFRSNKNWLESENYMYKHLIDGSRFGNRLGWHWVMGSQTGKIYGFSKFQVQKRAPKLCNECELMNNCPIENWPQVLSINNKELNIDLNLEKNFGPQSIQTSKDQPDFVWINGESLGDDDPALAALPDLPVIFVFDATLLKSLKLSTKRIIFLIEILKEISQKRTIKVYLDDPVNILSDKKFASTFAPVPKYKRITKIVKPTMEFPAKRLVEPINVYPRSFSSWRKKAKIIS